MRGQTIRFKLSTAKITVEQRVRSHTRDNHARPDEKSEANLLVLIKKQKSEDDRVNGLEVNAEIDGEGRQLAQGSKGNHKGE